MTAIYIIGSALLGALVAGLWLRAQLAEVRGRADRADELQRAIHEKDARIAEIQRDRDARIFALQKEHDLRITEMQREHADARVEASTLRERLEHERT